MLSLFSHIGPHEESLEYWSSYTDCFEFFVLTNKIKCLFLIMISGKTCSVLQSLVQHAKPGDCFYAEGCQAD